MTVIRQLRAWAHRLLHHANDLRARGPHRLRAHWAARRRLREWRQRLESLRAFEPERPLICLGLVEHLGDIAAAEPVARHLRATHPDALIVWPVRVGFRGLIEHNPAVDEVWEVGCLTEWMLAAPRAGFDSIVDLHLEGRSCAVCQRPHERADGDRSVNIRNYYRHGNLLGIFTRVAGLPPLTDGPRLHLPAEVRGRVNDLALPDRFIVVHCTSNQDVRDWRAERWQVLVERLVAERDVVVMEVGLQPVLRAGTQGVQSLCGRLSILETAEVIRRSRLFIGIDSGPAHLANATGTPGIVLLGHYRSYDWYLPYSGGYGTGAMADVIHFDGPAAEIPDELPFELACAWLDGRRQAPGDGADPSVSLQTADTRTTRSGRVSVVVPTYSHRDFVLASLDSVFAQTHPDVEVIVVNDGSPDDTAARLRPLVDAGRIRYLEQGNQGQGAARNRGLEIATGEFVAFLDDDDLWPPDTLSRLVAALESDPSRVMAYGDELRLLADGRLHPQRQETRPSGDAYRAFRRRNWLTSPGQAVMRAAAVRAVGGFDSRIWGSDDWDLYIRLARQGEFTYVGAPVLHYRIHAANASRHAVRHARNHLRVVRRHIGWDLPELVLHQRLVASYFVPNLMSAAQRARKADESWHAVHAHLYALLFEPQMLARPWFVRSLVESALGIRPVAREHT